MNDIAVGFLVAFLAVFALGVVFGPLVPVLFLVLYFAGRTIYAGVNPQQGTEDHDWRGRSDNGTLSRGGRRKGTTRY